MTSSNQLMTSTSCPLMFTLSPQINMAASVGVVTSASWQMGISIADRMPKLYPTKIPMLNTTSNRRTIVRSRERIAVSPFTRFHLAFYMYIQYVSKYNNTVGRVLIVSTHVSINCELRVFLCFAINRFANINVHVHVYYSTVRGRPSQFGLTWLERNY